MLSHVNLLISLTENHTDRLIGSILGTPEEKLERLTLFETLYHDTMLLLHKVWYGIFFHAYVSNTL